MPGYDDIMRSEHIKNAPRIIVGSDKERHTILNRNDARGMQLIWDDDRMHVRWDLSIAEAGNYKIVCHFRKPVPQGGDMILRFGTQNFTKSVKGSEIEAVSFESIYLNKGNVALDGWFWSKWRVHYTPFYIEMIKL